MLSHVCNCFWVISAWMCSLSYWIHLQQSTHDLYHRLILLSVSVKPFWATWPCIYLITSPFCLCFIFVLYHCNPCHHGPFRKYCDVLLSELNNMCCQNNFPKIWSLILLKKVMDINIKATFRTVNIEY